MQTMELIEVGDRLKELMIWVSRGEKIILTDVGEWVALLSAPPPKPPTEEEIAASVARTDLAFEQLLAMREARLAELEAHSNGVDPNSEFVR